MIELKELCERYRKLNVPAVSDQVDRLGYWHQVLNPGFRPLTMNDKLAGPAYTIYGTPSHELDKSKHLVKLHAVDNITPHSIVVYATNDDRADGHWGELLTNAVISHQVNGALIDGGVRDARQIIDMGFPLFHKFFSPGDSRGRFMVEEYQKPVIVGGVKINPGDFILGDYDGIIAIPKDVVEQVLLASETIAETENEIRDRIKKGDKLADLYMAYDTF